MWLNFGLNGLILSFNDKNAILSTDQVETASRFCKNGVEILSELHPYFPLLVGHLLIYAPSSIIISFYLLQKTSFVNYQRVYLDFPIEKMRIRMLLTSMKVDSACIYDSGFISSS